MLAKGKEKQTPPRPLIPWAVGTCSLSSLEAQKGAIVASSGKDHTLLDPRKTARSGTGRKARKSVSPLPGFVISGVVFSLQRIVCIFRAHLPLVGIPIAQTSPWKRLLPLSIYRAQSRYTRVRSRYSGVPGARRVPPLRVLEGFQSLHQ